MAAITIKDVPALVHRELKRRAAAERRTLSEEARLHLAFAMTEPPDPKRDPGTVLADMTVRRAKHGNQLTTDDEIRAAINFGRP